ncbi:MAG: hypothetical protein GTN81_09455 [Proteobacteria bacterium]|nr:hypothetical protein [Pseudomonadota bacterium]
MALDEPQNGDKLFNVDGVSYVMKEDFFDRVKPIAVDYTDSPEGSGFSISSTAYRFSLQVVL